jgi:hypothetical protein
LQEIFLQQFFFVEEALAGKIITEQMFAKGMKMW